MIKTNAGKWLAAFLALVLVAAVLLGAVAYVIDPFFQFRVRDHVYMLRGWFVDSGLIENYNYDTLIVGSSMTQNFDMNLFRSELGVRPLHVGMGGIRANEIQKLIALAYETGKADRFYVCVDLHMFSTDDGTSHYPEYLFRKDILSRLRYLFSYEVWFRYIPIDIVFMVLDLFGVKLPEKIENNRSVDKLEDWRLDFPETSVGEAAVLKNYVEKQYSVSEVDVTDLFQRMKKKIDSFLEGFSLDRGSHVFFFPPYSELFWIDARNSGYFEVYLQAKQYFVEQVTKQNAVVFDFQSAECTLDLRNYRDTTHYLPAVNDWMVRCFANGDYRVTPENFGRLLEKQRKNLDNFRIPGAADLQ